MITESAAVNALSVNKPREGGQSMITKSYWSLTWSMACFSRISREMVGTSSISAPANWIVAGIQNKFSTAEDNMTFVGSSSSIKIL